MVNGLVEKLSDVSAPPLGDRPVALLEVATIFAKWCRHRRREYPLFHETREVAAALDEWSAVTETAARLRLALPRHE